MPSGSQEEIELSTNNDDIHGINNNKSAFYETKRQSKAIRVLTVLAYVLSVSLAAIILSAYYVFMWEGKPSLAYQTCVPIEDQTSELNDSEYKILEEKEFSSDFLVNTTSSLVTSNNTEEISDILPNDVNNSTNDKRFKYTRKKQLFNYSRVHPNSRKNNYSEDKSETKHVAIRSIDDSSKKALNDENTMYLTTPTEENSTWLPQMDPEFEGDYEFMSKLFGYHKVKQK